MGSRDVRHRDGVQLWLEMNKFSAKFTNFDELCRKQSRELMAVAMLALSENLDHRRKHDYKAVREKINKSIQIDT